MIRKPQRLPDPTVAWVEPQTGRPTRPFFQYMRELDQAIRELIELADANQTSIAAIEVTLADHETRITDLETP